MNSHRLTFAILAFCSLVSLRPLSAAGDPATITLDPRRPTTSDRVRVQLGSTDSRCWPSTLTWDPPSIAGQTIRLNAHSGPGAGCGTPWPTARDLPALAAGPWSVEVAIDGQTLAAQAFDVTAPATDLFLRQGRFVATAQWKDSAGVSHSSQAVALSDESGYFWFFDSRNLELTLKLLDGRGINGHFWVFIASMTDVEYTVTVVDQSFVCVAGPCPNTRTYTGVARHNQNFIDVDAFSDAH